MRVKIFVGAAVLAAALACPGFQGQGEAQAGHRGCGPLRRVVACPARLVALAGDLRPARRAVRATGAIVHRLVHPGHRHRGRCR